MSKSFDYETKSEEVIVFDLFLPKKPEYLGALNDILLEVCNPRDHWRELGIDKIDIVLPAGLDQVARIEQVARGFSIMEVDGRFYSHGNGNFDDERSMVIRFILPKNLGGWEEEIEELEEFEVDGLRETGNYCTAWVNDAAYDVIINMIVRRLAKRIGDREEEIWVLRHQASTLYRVVRTEQ